MNKENNSQLQFYMDMSNHQMTANEFFCPALLQSLERNFGWTNAVISYFDTNGRFLSWVEKDGLTMDSEEHPYREIAKTDILRYMIYQDSVRDHLTYYNTVPKLYKATDVMSNLDYENTQFVKFLEKNFKSHYCVTLAFGINAYITVSFFKRKDEGDFTDEDMEELSEIYVFIANAYMTFKKYEQRKILLNIQSKIISGGVEKAYIVTDDFNHVMECNDAAKKYMEEILGESIDKQIGNMDEACGWLSFVLWESKGEKAAGMVQTRMVQDFILKVHTYDQTYSNGIVDRYHWITISRKSEKRDWEYSTKTQTLTHAEQQVAELMYNGLTYKEIAAKLVVSYHTVKKHVQNIYNKCGVKSRYQLYKWIENQENN
ncbi:MAG: helix-turn-helix transcriptional regulator [Lachnospiraceae bacterium]|nr:helix-turn-helix transcriptional regulator [Lachnospiraceae bacterium]